MNLITLLALSVALASDAFAVSVVTGFSHKNSGRTMALILAFYFGLFQTLMPVAGWITGKYLLNLFSNIDHWIAFVLLFAVGVKMIWGAFKKNEKNPETLKKGYIILLALATSIDAFAVGLTFEFLLKGIILSITVIGAITALLTYCGFFLGKKFGEFVGRKAEIFGGLILIAIGVKIVVEHLLNEG
ncbi:manganese efflux pump [candidate division WOR-3 bacterium]|nr:manganese efflux pump [candidate division WOR-3 bacterium]